MVSENFKDWLLASPTPSIHYLTLRHLLDRPESDTDVQDMLDVLNVQQFF